MTRFEWLASWAVAHPFSTAVLVVGFPLIAYCIGYCRGEASMAQRMTDRFARGIEIQTAEEARKFARTRVTGRAQW